MNDGRDGAVPLDEDDALVRQYQRGSARAFSRLYDKYRGRLYGYVLKNCADRDVAGELFQDVWVRVLASIDRYEPQGRFRQWLMTCAHNVVVDFYRRAKPRAEEVEPVDERSTDQSLEIAERIDAAVRQLPFDQRQAFWLREELSCSVQEIADIQDCTLEAAKSRLRYAYGKLREQLGDLV